MGLLPEFFLLLGTVVFVVISLLCAFFDHDLPSRFQFVFQVAGGAGLGILLISEAGTFGQNPDPTRIWISTIYLAFAVASVAGLNVYVGVARRNIALATKFSITMTAPTFMISAILTPSLGTLMIGISTLVIGLCVYVFFHVKSNHTGQATVEQESASASPIPDFPGATANRTDLQSPLSSKPEWEESSLEEAQ